MKKDIKKFLENILAIVSFIVIPILVIFALKYTYDKLGIQMNKFNSCGARCHLYEGDLIIYYIIPITILLNIINNIWEKKYFSKYISNIEEEENENKYEK